MKSLNTEAFSGPVICFGEVLWDMLPGGKKPGGAPLNVAIHLKKQGLSPLVVSRVGDDLQGNGLKEFLEHSGMELHCLQTDASLPTSEVLIQLDTQRNATYEICEPVAWDNIRYSASLASEAPSAGLIIYGSLASRNSVTRDTLFRLLDASAATRLMDVNLRPPYDSPGVVEKLLHTADFVKLNHEELFRIASWNREEGDEQALVRWFSSFYQCPGICVTRGADGALLFIGGEMYEHPGFKVEAIDTVGSGDAFLAGLVGGLSRGWLPADSLEYACAVGAFVASRNGAVPAWSPEEIDAFLKKR